MAMGRPREFEPDEVLDSVMRQFWEHGYRATSVDDLVRATGMKPGSLYAAFPGGKRALLMRSLKRYSKLVVPQKLGELAEQGLRSPRSAPISTGWCGTYSTRMVVRVACW